MSEWRPIETALDLSEARLESAVGDYLNLLVESARKELLEAWFNKRVVTFHAMSGVITDVRPTRDLAFHGDPHVPYRVAVLVTRPPAPNNHEGR